MHAAIHATPGRQHLAALGHEPAANEGQAAFSQSLVDELRTMPESFREAGYSTVGVVRIPHIHARYGFSQGFDEYLYMDTHQEAYESALSLLAEAKQPFFCYIPPNVNHGPHIPPILPDGSKPAAPAFTSSDDKGGA